MLWPDGSRRRRPDGAGVERAAPWPDRRSTLCPGRRRMAILSLSLSLSASSFSPFLLANTTIAHSPQGRNRDVHAAPGRRENRAVGHAVCQRESGREGHLAGSATRPNLSQGEAVAIS